MYNYALFFATLRLIIGMYNTVVREDVFSLVYLIMWILWTLVLYAVYFLGRRFKDKFVPMIVSLYFLAHLIIMYRVDLMEDEGKKSVEIMAWLRPIINGLAVIALLLLSPSIDYVLFCYSPCSLITLAICVFRYDLEGRVLINMVGWFIGMTIFWYIL